MIPRSPSHPAPFCGYPRMPAWRPGTSHKFEIRNPKSAIRNDRASDFGFLTSEIALSKNSRRRYTPRSFCWPLQVQAAKGIHNRDDLDLTGVITAAMRPPSCDSLDSGMTRFGGHPTDRGTCVPTEQASSAACWICGNQHYPPSWVEASNLAGSSGYWVGHSSESFAVELLSDREPGLAPGSRGYSNDELLMT